MRVLKGFVNIQSLMNNTAGTVSPIGEMSTLARTFSKEIGEYTNVSFPGFSLVSMYARNNSAQSYVLDYDTVQEVLALVSQIYQYSSDHGITYDVEDLYNNLTASFFGKISNISFGEKTSSGSIALPQWVKWDSAANSSTNTIWLADTAFREQYPEYEIVVIPPLANIDDLFLSFDTVKQKVALRDLSVLLEEAQVAKNNQPESYLRTLTYEYRSPFISSDILNLTWLVLVYGAQGDNQDAIKDAVISYVEKNSSKTNDEWMATMPEIFKRTEFVVLPRWDKKAIEDLSVEAGVYSSLFRPDEVIDFAINQISFYTADHVAANVLALAFPYRGIGLLVVDGPENVDTKADFATVYPDYICVSTTSLDFNRMTEATRGLCILLSEMLVVAEDLSETSSIPSNMRKITRGGKLYVSSVYNGVNIVVASPSSYTISVK